MKILKTIQFPEFTGVRCNMMPFIQGDSDSLPEIYQSYFDIINNNYLEKGKIGFLTIDESFVNSGRSQRGYNSIGINRNVHIEVGTRVERIYGWGTAWGRGMKTIINPNTEGLISNSISNTCKIWDTEEMRYTIDGDLSNYISDYPETTGYLMKAGELAKISVFTPHECIPQNNSSERQFIRIIGGGVRGREDYFTINPLLDYN